MLIEATSLSAWTKARPANDFARVRPALEKMLDLSRQLADFFPGYDHIADPLIDKLNQRAITPVIPPKANRKQSIECDFDLYRDRNRIERMFNRLKQFRRIATRYDKTARSFLAFLCLAEAKLWLPAFVNRS